MKQQEQYFLRRGSRTGGPLDAETVVKLIAAGKLRACDQCAVDRDGPWHQLGTIPHFQQMLQNDDGDESGVDDDYRLAPLTSAQSINDKNEASKATPVAAIAVDTGSKKPRQGNSLPMQTCLQCEQLFAVGLNLCPSCGFNAAEIPDELKTFQETTKQELGWYGLGIILVFLPVFVLVGSHFEATARVVQYVGAGIQLMGVLGGMFGFLAAGVMISPIGWIYYIKQGFEDGFLEALGQFVFMVMAGVLLILVGAGALFAGQIIHDYAQPLGGLSISLT